MSGHSKWATIKRKKGATDAARAKMWSKLLRFVEVAARAGGGNPDGNPTLATAIQKAKSASVPNDNIERAIKRGTGELEGESYEEISYEGYGPGGVAVLVSCLTNNRNRTSQDVRAAFNGQRRQAGRARRGRVDVRAEGRRGARCGGVRGRGLPCCGRRGGRGRASFRRWRSRSSLRPMRSGPSGTRWTAAGFEVESSDLTQVPKTTMQLEGSDAKKVLGLIDALEELDDVQDVYANFDIPDDVLASIA